MAPDRILDLLRQVPAAVTFLRGPDFVVEFAHPIAVAALGGRALEGRPLLEAIPEFADQPHVARMRRVYETGETSEETVRVLVDRSGTGLMEETYWHSTYQAIRDENGAIEGLLAFDLDVTKEVRRRRRLELLQEMTSALSRAMSVEEVARIVVEEGTAKLGAPRGGIWTLSDDGAYLDLLYDKGYSPALREAVTRLPMSSPLPLARVVATGSPSFFASRAEYALAEPASQAVTFPVRTSDELAFFCAPLRFEGKAVGAMTFNYPHVREFVEEERRFIEAMADQCAIALHRARLVASEIRARDAAERDRRRFQAVFEQSLDGIMLLDEALRVVDANAAACAILRRPREQIVGRASRELVPPLDEENSLVCSELLRRGETIAHREAKALLPDGSVRLLDLSASANVLPGLHLATFRDIDDQKRAEESLRFLEEASRMLARSLDPEETLAAVVRLAVPRLADWAAVDMLDAHGSIRHVVVQHRDPQKIELAHDMRRHRPMRVDGQGAVAQVLRTGEPILVERISDEMLVASLGSDPEYLAMVREAGLRSLMVIPLPRETRSPGAITFAFSESRRQFGPKDVAFAQELARRAAAAFANALAYGELRCAIDEQIKLRQRADRLYRLTASLASSLTTTTVVRTFCAHAPQALACEWAAVWLRDAERGELVLTGGSGEATAARDGTRVALDDSSSPVARVARERAPVFDAAAPAAEGAAIVAHVPLASARGAPFAVASFGFAPASVVGDEDRAMLLAVADQCALALDRARAYEAEAVALRKKDEFLAMLGHELRNPLAPILTATSIIRLRGAASERELDVLERQGRHLVRLVDDLLDVSRIAAGKLALSRRPIEIADVVAQAVESAGKALEDKRLRVEMDVPREGLSVDGDRERLVQVVTNLLVNAAKFTPAGATVGVRASRRGDAVALEVRDEGEGIAPDLLPTIFEPFTQGRQASDRRDGGLGLGLAISRSIIEAHGGRIAAASGGRDRGTTISITLPWLERRAAPDVTRSATGAAPRPTEAARRVLIVDDNGDAAEMIATFLGGLGYETSVASDGPEALTAVARARPDAAILDIGLPGMDGYELASELRTRYGDRAPPLIALTGYAQSMDRHRALASGFLAHFGKPVDVERLAAALSKILTTRD